MIRIILLMLSPVFAFTQPPADRYQAELFTAVTETNNIQFSTAVPQPVPGGGFYEWLTGLPLNVEEFNTTAEDLKMDIFEPSGDTLSQRPLIIICFGGGFLSGSRTHWSIRLLCEDLAKRGFITAAIDYRLGMNVFDSDLAMRAVYRGVQDARSAVRFFRADAAGANTYKIDPDNIFIGGHSSGAFMALHNAYLETEIERPLSTYTWTQDGNVAPDQLPLDSVGGNRSYSGHANAIFSLAGALGYTDLIDTPLDPNAVMFHSTDDDTVPYYSGEPFSGIIWLVIGSDLPTVYGSQPISLRSDTIGLPYNFYSYTNREHGVHEDGSTQLYNDIIPGISDWFFNETLKPLYEEIKGDSVICTGNTLAQNYHLPAGPGTYFDWQITGGTFSQMTTDSAGVSVNWNPGAASRSIAVTPYSELDAKGDSLVIEIQEFASATNVFLELDDNWANILNWDQGHIPTHCEDVRINTSALPLDLSLTIESNINSLFLGENINLEIGANGNLVIYQKNPFSSQFALDVQGEILNLGNLHVTNKKTGMEIKISNPGKIDNVGDSKIGKD